MPHIHCLHSQLTDSIPIQPAAARSSVRLNAEGPSIFEWGSRFLNELLPWGDTSKGLWAGKRDAMVEKWVSFHFVWVHGWSIESLGCWTLTLDANPAV